MLTVYLDIHISMTLAPTENFMFRNVVSLFGIKIRFITTHLSRINKGYTFKIIKSDSKSRSDKSESSAYVFPKRADIDRLFT